MRPFALVALLLVALLSACGAEQDDPERELGPDAGTAEQADAAPGAAERAFMDSCDPAADLCADELVCFQFNSRGPFCTHGCASDADCPAPSRGCNNMGVCKAP